MINKIGQTIEHTGLNKIVRKSFQRNLQTIESTSAYIGDKLYFRGWRINEYKHSRKLSQAYNAGVPIKGSKSVLDIVI